MSISFSKGNRIFVLYIIIAIIILALLIPKLSSEQARLDLKNSHLSVWSKEYILTFKNHTYIVTDQLTEDIGPMIGGVTYHGNNPGSFNLFLINQVNNYSKIAIETKSGYLIAILEK